MRYGSRRQIASTALAITRLSPVERERLRKLAAGDERQITDYVLDRIDGVLYACNGYSTSYDLTHDCNTDADSNHEAAEYAENFPTEETNR